jgi:lipopolysaccharide transport system permease protein
MRLPATFPGGEVSSSARAVTFGRRHPMGRAERAWWWLALPVQRVAEVIRYRGLLWNLVRKDFEVRYADSLIGVLWTQLYPLLQLVVYGFVFTAIFHISRPNYILFLFVGIILWMCFSTALINSALSITANAGLITNVYFPRELVPVSTVLVGFTDLILSHGVLAVGLLYFGVPPSPAWLLVPAMLALFGLFCVGCGLIVSTANAYFHDVRYFIDVGLVLLMFLSGIWYPPEVIPPGAQWVLVANPVATFLIAYREIVLEGIVPDPGLWLRCAGAALVFMVVGLHVFDRGQRGFAEIL